MKQNLTERKMKILKFIVEEYISTAEPIGSRTISKNKELAISAATIRNEMSDLEEMGYLIQPHVSAGRVPSKKMMTIENLIEKNKIIIGKKIKNKINMKKYHYYIKAIVVFFC